MKIYTTSDEKNHENLGMCMHAILFFIECEKLDGNWCRMK